MTAKKAPPGGGTAAGALAGPLFAAGEAEGAGSDAPEQSRDLPPPGDMADAESTADAGGEAPDDTRRLNENMEQMLEGMDTLLDVLVKTQSQLESAKGEKQAEAGEGAPAADAAPAEDGVPVHTADFYRWIETDRRRRRRWPALAAGIAAPAALLLGLLVEQQFQVIPLHDPTGGWRGHIWEQYGRSIVDCAVEAMRTNAEVDCPLVVRRP